MAKYAFVIPRKVLVEQGFIPADTRQKAIYTRLQSQDDLTKLLKLAAADGTYRERGGDNDVEQDASVQQLIIYAYVQLADGRFMLYQRGSDGYSESRLAGKVSLGIGGHMEPTDLSLMDAFYRELDEETIITEHGKALQFTRPDKSTDVALMRRYVSVEPVGIIKDERDAVGKAHLGIACKLVARDDVDISIRAETGENVRSFYVTLDEYDTLVSNNEITPEGWTSIVIDNELRPIGSRV